MTTIEKIRAEIERLKGQLIRGACAAQIEMETNCKDEAYNEILSILDTLEESEESVDADREEIIGLSIMAYLETHLKHDKSVVLRGVNKVDAREWIRRQIEREKSEKTTNLDLEKEIASFITQFGWGNTKHLAEKELINCTARHFANIGWNFGYIKGREDAHKPAREVGLPKRFDKQPACDGLEEEIERYLSTKWELDEDLNKKEPIYIYDCTWEDLKVLARHFYKLGIKGRE